ncbi:uncharacterized sulfatase [Pseudarcicella hirudinis]|uniref:Uncharacterized sulfatase n=2 Tax=Pseudarcicella hirudinis TaxID=1079859 RepID=A0A1I5X438_9BACT|nr:uncharacterized sulfatase [Pseudarcicella hirudinis]
MKDSHSSFKLPDSFALSIRQFGGLSLVWCFIIFFLRIVEMTYSAFLHELAKPFFKVLGLSLLNDLYFFFQSSCVLFVMHCIFSVFSIRLAKNIYLIICLILTLLQLSLMQYFFTSLVPLSSDIFNYSLKDIQQTVGASGGVPIGGVIAIIVIEVLVYFAFRLLTAKLSFKPVFSLMIPLLSFAAFFFGINTFIKAAQFGNEYTNNLTINKSEYFTNASYKYFFDKDDGIDIYADNYLGLENLIVGSDKNIENVSYLAESAFPFLHQDNTPDVLGPFLSKSEKKPNIVVLIVEGLGRAFSGENAYLGSYTPYIDSLSAKSLYWENFLSEGGRTFAVLPSLLGSLPFAKAGFNELGPKMPDHVSLVSILRKQGYYTSFYYGGDAGFDNMSMFLKKSGIDRVNDEGTYGAGYVKMPTSPSGFSWGYGDKELFRRFFTVNEKPLNQPRLDVVLTVSTHNPFLINEQEKYLDRFEKRLDFLKFNEEEKVQSRQNKNMLASVLYMDDAVRYFIENYRKRPEFANTIFFITGDHRMPEIPMSTKIDRYHVPLIVYSPLLKRTAVFKSISTHFDVTPSILAFLNKNYGVGRPAVADWLGTGIDTTRQFRNIHSYPIMMTKAELVDYIRGGYLLNNNDLYRISDGMGLELVDEKPMQNQLKGAFEQFKQRNNRMLGGSKLIPDSVLTKFNH